MYNFIVEVPVFQTNLYFDKKIRTKVELKKMPYWRYTMGKMKQVT